MFRTFLDQCLAGQAAPNDVDLYISKWHDDPTTTLKLHEYLGLTWEEYKRWAEDANEIESIVRSHGIHQPA